MPYQVIKDPESETESLTKTRAQMAKEIKDLQPGAPVLGYIGEPPPSSIKEPVVVTKLTPDEINEMVGIQNLLKKYINPPALGSKFTERQSLLRFYRKIEKQSLEQLRRFWTKPIPEDGVIPLEEQVEIQSLWEELSP